LAIIIPLILLLIAALVWWPAPGKSIEENTGRAAPLQKITTPAAAQETPAAQNQTREGEGAARSQVVDDAGAEGEVKAEPTALATEPATMRPTGGYRIHTYD
jgi:hypothetical protein